MKQPEAIKYRSSRKFAPVAPFPEHGHSCLNCGHEVSNNFCSVCGQRTDTHRLSIKHFVLHDMVHSFWHVDRGIFLTLKEVIIRPGYAALEYIRGKRAGKFPILTLLLLLTGLTLWLYSLGAPAEAASPVRVRDTNSELGNQINTFVKENAKWLLLSLLPLGSLSTLIVFRRTKLNFTEHLVVNSYVFAGLLSVLVIIKLIMLGIPATSEFLKEHSGLVAHIFYGFGYWQAFHKVYRIPGMIWRFVSLWLLNLLLLIIVMGLTLGTTSVIRPDLLKSRSPSTHAVDSSLH